MYQLNIRESIQQMIEDNKMAEDLGGKQGLACCSK